jgi:hypothetical protein
VARRSVVSWIIDEPGARVPLIARAASACLSRLSIPLRPAKEAWSL